MRQDLIEKVKSGKWAIENNGSYFQLYEIGLAVNPKIASSIGAAFKFYWFTEKGICGSDLTDRPTIPVTDFFLPEFEVGEMIEVRNEDCSFMGRKYLGMFNGWYMVEICSVPYSYKYARKLTPTLSIPEAESKLKELTGKEFKIK